MIKQKRKELYKVWISGNWQCNWTSPMVQAFSSHTRSTCTYNNYISR